MTPTSPPPLHCPLCGASVTAAPVSMGERIFHDCDRCGLLFAHPSHHLSPAEERERYDRHENAPRDPDYRAFLAQLVEPLARRLPPGARGLDFGAGPGPTVSRMLTERGFPTRDWDPFYAPRDHLLERQWDFVTATEVVEHLHRPARDFATLGRLVRPGGWVGLMTVLFTDDVDPADWWYARDLTHVSFYRPRTLDWIGGWLGWRLDLRTDRVALFQAGDGMGSPPA